MATTAVSIPPERTADYSALELAEVWNVSDDYIRELFKDEPDVLIYGRSMKRRTMRIPVFVAKRVRQRIANK
jgi:hypothetical protein